MCARRADGFTLLEVLVALVIAGLALIVLFRAGGEGLFAVDAASRAEEAVERGQSHLAAVGRQYPLVQDDVEGDDGGGYHWRLHITPLASRQVEETRSVSVVATTLFDVEIEVSWAGRGRDRSVVLKTRRIGAVAATR